MAGIIKNSGMGIVSADILGGSPLGHSSALERLKSSGLGKLFRPGEIAAAGLTYEQLRTFVRRGQVEHVRRGLYRIAETEPTEDYSLAFACARVPRSVVCLLSALRVHGIGTQAPSEVWLAIPHKSHPPRLPDLRLRIVRFSGAAWTYGIDQTTFEGVAARITSPARTIVDCFRFEHLVGTETAMEALREGLRRKRVTASALSRVLEVLPSRRLQAALEVILA